MVSSSFFFLLINIIFPLYQLVFYFVPEQTIFNGNSTLFQTGLKRFLFPFRTVHYVFKLVLEPVNIISAQRNHTELFISGIARNATGRVTFRSAEFQLLSDPMVMLNNE